MVNLAQNLSRAPPCRRQLRRHCTPRRPLRHLPAFQGYSCPKRNLSVNMSKAAVLISPHLRVNSTGSELLGTCRLACNELLLQCCTSMAAFVELHSRSTCTSNVRMCSIDILQQPGVLGVALPAGTFFMSFHTELDDLHHAICNKLVYQLAQERHPATARRAGRGAGGGDAVGG